MNIFNPYHYALFLWKTFLSYKKQSQYQCKLIIKKAFNILTLMALVLFSTLSQAGINTGLGEKNNVTEALPIGFSFNLYGENFTKFYVSTNGLLQFTGATTASYNTCLPASHANTLYVFWDSLKTNLKGITPISTIQYETIGEAPNRQLIVQWTGQYFPSNKLMGTFQAILYEGSNQIKFQYRSLLDTNSTGNSATIGIQGFNEQAKQIGCNQANTLRPKQAILFTPNSDMTDYNVDANAEYNFIDIALILDAPIATSRYTKNGMHWSWYQIETFNTYEAEVHDQLSNIVFHNISAGSLGLALYINPKHGNSYRARIRGSVNNGATWETWSEYSSPITADLGKPSVQIDSFSRTSTDSAKITYKVTDDLSGVASAQIQIATDTAFTNIIHEQALSTNSNILNVEKLATTSSLYARISAVDLVGNESGFSATKSIDLLPPVIVKPVTNSTVKQAKLQVMGTAEIEGNVQLYLNGKVHGSRITLNAENNFTTEITLLAEGTYKLSADIQNSFGTSERSSEVNFTYKLPTPKASFVKPAENLTLSAPTDIEISAIDDLGISKVELYIDDTKLATLTEAPYLRNWDVTTAKNGNHTIKAVITNTSGKSITETRQVTVNVIAPEPPATSYTGEITSISPTTSYGPQPITFKGNAVYRADATNAANAPLILVLSVNGFDKKIDVVTDDTGAFTYTFAPQGNDAGIYTATAIHPKEKITPSQGSFAINRIKFNISGYNLSAARTIKTPINVTATTSAGATELRWVARAEDQPTGSLPKGITIDGGKGVNIAAGKSAPTQINFTADNTAAEYGSVFLVAFAKDSGDLIRGRFQINYRLTQPIPILFPTPTRIDTGVQQEHSITETIKLGNRGLIAAENVQLKLLDAKNNAVPSWIFISSSNLGAVNVGDSIELQLTAQPDASIADGIYHFQIAISTDNGQGGNIPITVSVTQKGQGSVSFDVADIYTATLDKNGQLIEGVANATIKLQNDIVLTQQYQVRTNSQGIATINDIPPGVYRYRASAPEHKDTSGRIVIRAGVTTNEHIFLEYDLINIEFGVTETIVEDEYEIEVEVSFNTQVPAPVIVFEPTAINLVGMKANDIKTGELVITNYGMVQADNIKFTPPVSDKHYKYEFLAEIPTVLEPKTRLVIPYKVTALDSTKKASRIVDDCTSYTTYYYVEYSSECANGDTSKGNSKGQFYKLKGSSCNSGSIGGSNWDSSGWSGGGWGGGSGGWTNGWGTPSPMPMTPACIPDCEDGCGGAGSEEGGK